MKIQKEYNLRYLLAKVRTTWENASDRLRQRGEQTQQKSCRTSWSGIEKSYCRTRFDVGSDRVKSCNALLRVLLACSRSFLKFVMRYKFLIWMQIIRTPYIYVSSGMRIRGYFSKPIGICEQKVLGHNDLQNYTLSIFL
jgi:hypothetical protein